MVLDQVKQQRKNLFMMWFDYRKAFSYLPHSQIIKALHLAKVPEKNTKRNFTFNGIMGN